MEEQNQDNDIAMRRLRVSVAGISAVLCACVVACIGWIVCDGILLSIRTKRAASKVQDALKEDEQGRYGRIQQVFEQLKTEWSPCDLTGVLYHIAIPSDPSDERAILVVEMGSVLSDALKRCCCYEIVRLLKAKPQFENDVIYRARLADECVERCEPLQEVIRSRMKLGDTMLECAIPIIAKLKNPADVPLFASILEDLLTIEAEGEFGLRELVVYLDNYGQQGQFAIRDIARRQGDKSLLRLLRDAVENTLGDDDETRGALPEVFAE